MERLRLLAWAAVAAGCHGGAPPDLRPAVLLAVLDTTRADAVSAYGVVRNTTPFVDRLAQEGLLYRRAFSNAPWTLPSHATLFTGEVPSAHGVGIRTWRAPDGLPTIAASFTAAGYETAGLSENPFVGELTNLQQGFTSFQLIDDVKDSGMVASVSAWLARRHGDPFFLFVNIIDAHAPYEVRPQNPFLPDGVDATRARGLLQAIIPAPLCHGGMRVEDVDILRGLYLGDVAAADRKLAGVHEAARRAAGRRPLLTIVTADHGESFGEQRLLGHLFGMGNQILQVPLVVHGLPGVAPAVIQTPVQLADVAPTLLEWAGIGSGRGRASRRLPTGGRDGPVPVVAQYRDLAQLPRSDTALFRYIGDQVGDLRAGCQPGDRVFGDMDAVIAYPHKAVAFERHDPALYDLVSDPGELHDLARAQPATAAKLLDALPGRRP